MAAPAPPLHPLPPSLFLSSFSGPDSPRRLPQAVHGGSTQGVAVKGTLKTDKQKAKLKKEKETGAP